MAAIIIVFELPPRLSLRSQVRTESRYGINNDFLCPLVPDDNSANAEITEPKVTNDLFMCAPSLSL